MLKYIEEDTLVGFREICDEISCLVNISGCQNACVGCHSPYLRENIGRDLDSEAIDELIKTNDGITCFCFMGEGNDQESLKNAILYIKNNHKDIKVALYSGRVSVPEDWLWENLDYLKIGPYRAEFGPLDKTTTNQRMYKNDGKYASCCVEVDGATRYGWKDITSRYWK